MRLASPRRWLSTASATTGAILIALALGVTPQMDHTLAASVSTSGSSTLRAAGGSVTSVDHDADPDGGHGSHDGDGHGHAGDIDHGHGERGI
jgi:hypothetical protein